MQASSTYAKETVRCQRCLLDQMSAGSDVSWIRHLSWRGSDSAVYGDCCLGHRATVWATRQGGDGGGEVRVGRAERAKAVRAGDGLRRERGTGCGTGGDGRAEVRTVTGGGRVGRGRTG